jgi:hypothetical protein
MKILMN